MATTKPLGSITPAPRPVNVCDCGLEQTRFVLRDGKGGKVERSMCFVCGRGVPPRMWAEQQIERNYASAEMSGWIIFAAPAPGLN